MLISSRQAVAGRIDRSDSNPFPRPSQALWNASSSRRPQSSRPGHIFTRALSERRPGFLLLQDGRIFESFDLPILKVDRCSPHQGSRF